MGPSHLSEACEFMDLGGSPHIFPLVKQLLHTRDLILSVVGSSEIARQKLAEWFARDGHMTYLGILVLRSHGPRQCGRQMYNRVMQYPLDVGTKAATHERQTGVPGRSAVHLLSTSVKVTGAYILQVPPL